MKAIDALKFPLPKFMEAVSEAISPKPWKHELHWTYGEYTCLRCRRKFTVAEVHGKDWRSPPTGLKPYPCDVPPKLTDAPEAVAMQLRDRASERGTLRSAWVNLLFTRPNIEETFIWMALYFAAPQEQIACCLVALELWKPRR